MNWWTPKNPVTVCDVLESGACFDGVIDWLSKHNGAIAGDPANYRAPEIKRAANLNGDGHGYGYGYGDGCGDGYGYGHGNGDGYGDGNGDGYGDGWGGESWPNFSSHSSAAYS